MGCILGCIILNVEVHCDDLKASVSFLKGFLLLFQWQYCTSYRMIYFLYEVNCCFLSILLHKYLILCFFTSYSREIIIRKKFWSHPAAKWIGSWLFLLLLSILMAACLRQIDMSHAKEWVLLGTHFDNVYIFKGKQRIYFIFYPFSLN